MNLLNKFFRAALLTVTIFSVTANAQTNKNEELIIFHAGSLTLPFKKIIDGFEKENPGVKVFKEIAGSRACARKITELNKECDIMASADYTVIDNLLIPDYADWNIKFASNEMAIVYTEHSRMAKEINKKNWYNILLNDAVSIGRSDPNSDPCGYRAVLTMKLTEVYYNQIGLAEKLIEKDKENIRPKETDLIALLETGELDFIFLYKSVAVQHGLKYLTLPIEVNLKGSELDEYYRQVSVEISGKKPGETITQYGRSMLYGFTIPNNSPNPELAVKFAEYLLDQDKGLKILEEAGQPSSVSFSESDSEKIPMELRKFIIENNGNDD